jgi:hypothetical protein
MHDIPSKVFWRNMMLLTLALDERNGLLSFSSAPISATRDSVEKNLKIFIRNEVSQFTA